MAAKRLASFNWYVNVFCCSFFIVHPDHNLFKIPLLLTALAPTQNNEDNSIVAALHICLRKRKEEEGEEEA